MLPLDPGQELTILAGGSRIWTASELGLPAGVKLHQLSEGSPLATPEIRLSSSTVGNRLSTSIVSSDQHQVLRLILPHQTLIGACDSDKENTRLRVY